jgi:hypothetical protein
MKSLIFARPLSYQKADIQARKINPCIDSRCAPPCPLPINILKPRTTPAADGKWLHRGSKSFSLEI